MLRNFIAFLLIFSLLLSQNIFAQNEDANRPDSPDQKVDSLKVVTWNLYLLPRFLLRSGQMQRVGHIAETLIEEDYDVLLLQEVFGKKSSAKLHEGLKDHYPYFLGPANKKGSPFKANSGAMIYSKYPLELLTEFRFEDCKGVDCWGRKGGVVAEMEKNGQRFQLMSTHLQAFAGEKRDKIRLLQYHQINRDIVETFREAGVPQVLGGDFNTLKKDTFHYRAMLKVLDAEDGDCNGDVGCTYFSQNNDLIGKGEYQELLDYIFLVSNGFKPMEIERSIRTFRSDWDLKKRKRKGKRKDLSDHYAVEMILKY